MTPRYCAIILGVLLSAVAGYAKQAVAGALRVRQPTDEEKFLATDDDTNDTNTEAQGQIVRQVLKNEGDVQYTTEITLGKQKINVVPDTGSFELVMLSDTCKTCGSTGRLFHSKKSKTLKEGELSAEQNYGSGSTDSLEAYDDVGAGRLRAKHQMFWEVYDANMPLLQVSSFAGIFGLGPPSSAEKMAESDARQVKQDVNDLKKSGQNVTEYEPIVQEYENVAKFVKTVDLWLSRMKVEMFSVCLGKDMGSDGYLIYNDKPDMKLFTSKVEATGDLYWSVKIRKIELKGASGTINPTDLAGGGEDLIFDTGTSLLAVPDNAYKKITNAVKRYSHFSRGCSNMTELPNLEISVNDATFILPPESYMGETVNMVNYPTAGSEVLEVMPHLEELRGEYFKQLEAGETAESEVACVPLIMSLGDEDQWILGMPFFRVYYTTFHLASNYKDPKAMYFGRPNDKCELSADESEMRQVPMDGQGERKPMRVDVSKILLPRQLRKKRVS